MKSNLIIDVGNTRTKVAIFENRELIKLDNHLSLSEEKVSEYLVSYNISGSIFSSVTASLSEIEGLLKRETNYIKFNTSIPTAVNLQYKSPETLGLDRFAAIIAAQSLYKGVSCLVIDAGTCITYDNIDQHGVYKGGSISPGLNMRFSALNHYTKKLPLLSADDSFDKWYGERTNQCIISGVQNGAFSEIVGFINYYNSEHPHLQILLCGGDSEFFGTRLKNSIFAERVRIEPDLVLIGLNEVIYQHND